MPINPTHGQMTTINVIGHNTVRLDSVDSTNNYAAKQINQTFVPEGTVILADNQTAGKGQPGNSWHSIPGKNLTFSLILRPTFLLANDQFLISMAVSIGIREGIYAELGIWIDIKWPNDLFHNNKKIGGILIENQISGKSISSSIVGIGLNVNQRNLPVTNNANSLANICGEELDLEQILDSILSKINAYYLQLVGGGRMSVKTRYLQSLLLYKQIGWYRKGDKSFAGSIVDVSDNGQLVIKLESGELTKFNFQEIKFLL